MKIFTYTIFCKVCKKDNTHDINLDQEITGLGHIRLNCFRCNDYSIYLGGKYFKPNERFRYDLEKTTKNLKLPIKFSFGYRYDNGLDNTK